MPEPRRILEALARRLSGKGPEPPGVLTVSRRRLALVFGLALVLRLVYFWHIAGTPLATNFVPDLEPYLFYAERLIDGRFFFQVPLLMSPGYPLFIAPLIIAFGENVPVLVLANLCLDALSAVLVCQVAGRLFKRVTAFDAGLCYALCGPALFHAGLPLGQGPAVFFSLAATLGLLDAPQRKAPLSGYLAGVCLGLACLMRPNLFLAFPIWVLLLVRRPWRGDRAWRLALARFIVGLAAMLAPFVLHNIVLEGSPTPFGAQGGYSFYSGNHPGSSGANDGISGISSTPFKNIAQSRDLASLLSGREMGFGESSGFWFGKGLEFFAGHPAEALGLLGRKALLALNNGPPDGTMDYEFCRQFSFLLDVLDLPVGAFLGLGLLGLFVPGRRKDAPWLAEAFFLAGLGSVVLFTVQPRFLAPVLPFALPYASHLATELTEQLRGRRWRVALATGLLAAGLVGLSYLPAEVLTRRPSLRALDHYRFGRYYARVGESAKAAQEFRAALAREPGNAGFRWFLGVALLASGEREAALSELSRAATQDPRVTRPEFWSGGG